MPRISTAFRVPYSAVEPTDLAWTLADDATRAAFRREVVRLVLAEKDSELAAGRDRHGLKLARITKWTREHRRSEMGEADPSAPPLTPAYGLSRTRAYLDGRATQGEAEFFWRSGWGKILHYHRIGARNAWAKRGRLPVRDVIGLSNASINRVRSGVLLWWQARQPKAPAAVVPIRPTVRKSVAVPRRKPAPVAAKATRRVPRVLVLPKDARPSLHSKHIQVFEV